jgi:hypothetical protein
MALGTTARLRFDDSAFFPGQNTWQNLSSNEFARNTSITTGVQPELDRAVRLFTGGTVDVADCQCFWTPTQSQWNTIANALSIQ